MPAQLIPAPDALNAPAVGVAVAAGDQMAWTKQALLRHQGMFDTALAGVEEVFDPLLLYCEPPHAAQQPGAGRRRRRREWSRTSASLSGQRDIGATHFFEMAEGIGPLTSLSGVKSTRTDELTGPHLGDLLQRVIAGIFCAIVCAMAVRFCLRQ
jgi:hypothetical protein